MFAGLLSVFAVCVAVGGSKPELLRVGMGAGVLLAAFAAMAMVRARPPMIPEIGLFWLFVVWCGVTGYIKLGLEGGFVNQMGRLLQNGAILSVVGVYSASRRSLAPSLIASVVVASVLVIYGFLTGDFQLASEVRQQGEQIIATRAQSLSGNANALGLQCVWAIAALAYFWGRARSRILRWLLVGWAPALLAGIVYSASRKSFLLVFLFLLGWGWFCYRTVLLRNLRFLLGGVLVILAGYYFASVALKDTYLGQRFANAETRSDGSTIERIALSREAADFFLSNPVAGIGLGQMRQRSVYGMYAHSEYLEILCTTGAVGGVLYFSMYLLLWKRLFRIRAVCPDPTERFAAGCALAMLTCYFVVSPALVSFASMSFFCLASGWIGYAYGVESHLGVGTSRFKTRRFGSSSPRERAQTATGLSQRPGQVS